MSTCVDRAPGRCRAKVERNGYYTGRRCSRRAVDSGLCRQHAAKEAAIRETQQRWQDVVRREHNERSGL